MSKPKFQVNDIVSDCDLEGEFIIREIGIVDGFFYEYWVEGLDENDKFNCMACYEDDLTLIRRGE